MCTNKLLQVTRASACDATYTRTACKQCLWLLCRCQKDDDTLIPWDETLNPQSERSLTLLYNKYYDQAINCTVFWVYTAAIKATVSVSLHLITKFVMSASICVTTLTCRRRCRHAIHIHFSRKGTYSCSRSSTAADMQTQMTPYNIHVTSPLLPSPQFTTHITDVTTAATCQNTWKNKMQWHCA